MGLIGWLNILIIPRTYDTIEGAGYCEIGSLCTSIEIYSTPDPASRDHFHYSVLTYSILLLFGADDKHNSLMCDQYEPHHSEIVWSALEVPATVTLDGPLDSRPYGDTKSSLEAETNSLIDTDDLQPQARSKQDQDHPQMV